MLLFQSSLGVEIGDDSVVIVHLKGSFKGILPSASAICPFKQDLPLADKLAVAGDFLRDFIEKNRISGASIFLGIPRRTVIVRYIELPFAVKENLREAIGYDLEKYAPVAADNAYFDCQIVEENSRANKIRVLLALMKKESLDPYLELRKHRNVEMSGIEMSSTAIANYFSHLSRAADKDPYAFVYLRGSSAELNMVRRKLLIHSRSLRLPDGQTDACSLLASELVPLKAAQGENGKTKFFLLAPDGESDLVKRLRERLDFEVYPSSSRSNGVDSSELIAAYGLALKGIQKVPMDINLMPSELRKKPSRVGYYVMLLLAAMLLISFGSWAVSSVLWERSHLKRLNSEIARLSVEMKEIENLRKRCEELENEIGFLNGVRRNSGIFLIVLKDLTERIPKTAWVSALTFSEQGVQIGGYAESASALIPILEASPFLKEAVFLSTITKTRDGKERFEIGLKMR